MSERLRAARIDFSDAAAPRSLDFDDLYHPRAGSLAQARHVFLAGNGLPARWSRRPHFVILETGFGLGHNFLATWAAWRADPQRCDRLWFVSIEKHPPTLADLQRAHTSPHEPELARQLLQAWPPLTPDLHQLDFADGRVVLRLAFGDVAFWLPQLMAGVDGFFLDGFAPACNPQMWAPHLLKRLRHLAAPGATAATWSVARPVRDGLAAAGFVVERQPGVDAKREMLTARFAPRYALSTPAGRCFGRPGSVAVVGAGLAGAATARALGRHGVPALVFEQAEAVATGASSQRGGLLHGVVHAEEGPYSRWHRAAFLHAARVLHPLVEARGVPGQLHGLLRLEQALMLDSMRQRLEHLGLSREYVVALDAAQASQLAGVPIASAAWFYPGAGWIDPRAAVKAWLNAGSIDTRCNVRIDRLERSALGRWRLLDGQARCVAEVDHVVLANAHDARRLADVPLGTLRSTRGQTTIVPFSVPDRPLLRLPLAGAGYALSLTNGDLLCGATSDLDDDFAALRDNDHRRNLDALQSLIGQPVAAPAWRLDGRVAWRLSTGDRLPLVGAVPAPEQASTRADQARFIPRREGLHILAGLGSRGIAQSALSGEIVASWISGAPMPVEAVLLDAVDAARYAARAARFRNAAA